MCAFFKKIKFNYYNKNACYSNIKCINSFFKMTINNGNRLIILKARDTSLNNNDSFVIYCYKNDTDIKFTSRMQMFVRLSY